MRSSAAPADALPKPLRMQGNWSLYADKQRRPASWIGHYASTSQPLTIVFRVFFSHKPRLEITIMRSYESFLDASVTLNGFPLDSHRDELPELRGSWAQHYSLPDITVWDSRANFTIEWF